MNYYRLGLRYDGTGYAGFQWQKEAATVQSVLNDALATLVGGKLSTLGASRTDTGVHAHDQVVKLTCERAVATEDFVDRLNRVLPAQIRCHEIRPVSGEFHPSTAALTKEYRYLFTNQRVTSDDQRRFVANMATPLDLPLMQECVKLLIGKHDFKNFTSTGSNVKTTVREVLRCELSLVNPHSLVEDPLPMSFPTELQECFQLQIIGQGFLKQMIRHLMAALWLVGSKKLTPAQFHELLTGSLVTKQQWTLASPKGLHLFRIRYE